MPRLRLQLSVVDAPDLAHQIRLPALLLLLGRHVRLIVGRLSVTLPASVHQNVPEVVGEVDLPRVQQAVQPDERVVVVPEVVIRSLRPHIYVAQLGTALDHTERVLILDHLYPHTLVSADCAFLYLLGCQRRIPTLRQHCLSFFAPFLICIVSLFSQLCFRRVFRVIRFVYGTLHERLARVQSEASQIKPDPEYAEHFEALPPLQHFEERIEHVDHNDALVIHIFV